ncbi:MAG: exodeoxyribonuclease VII large subunit [Chloroflexota bacterium]
MSRPDQLGLPLGDEPPHPADTPLARAPEARPGEGRAGRPERALPRILGVAELTGHIKQALRVAPSLRDVWVEGEVGQVTVSSAGHCYFTLKDERASIRSMIFRDDRLAMPFQPRTGIRLVAHGRIDVFDAQGVYQLYVDTLQPAGFGDLALRFEALKAQLTQEGLFEAARKRPLPPWPRVIGVCTSLSGAVLHDIRRVLARRWPSVRVLVSACQVQGAGAPESVVAALRRAARWTDPQTGRAMDLVILARGGGSLEDLWAFNEEAVVRAVAAMPVPVVVGVGHETDVTLAEFAADVRAATPSVAAELAVPDRLEQAQALRALGSRLTTDAGRIVAGARMTLDGERRALEASRPAAVLAAERERAGLLLDRATRAVGAQVVGDRARLQRLADRLPGSLAARLARDRAAVDAASATLMALGPWATLDRGDAIVRDERGGIVRDAAALAPTDRIEVRLARGSVDARVEAVRDSGA